MERGQPLLEERGVQSHLIARELPTLVTLPQVLSQVLVPD